MWSKLQKLQLFWWCDSSSSAPGPTFQIFAYVSNQSEIICIASSLQNRFILFVPVFLLSAFLPTLCLWYFQEPFLIVVASSKIGTVNRDFWGFQNALKIHTKSQTRLKVLVLLALSIFSWQGKQNNFFFLRCNKTVYFSSEICKTPQTPLALIDAVYECYPCE